MDEESLTELLFRFPGILPVAAIDAAYAAPVPICRELHTPAGPIDALYINDLGRLILAEFKLWRNPQARREVIGQILDYTKELASWTYEDLQREVSKALRRKGNAPYKLVHEQAPDIEEAKFVDNVSRHLKRGEFLLLIIGDGIREGVENIVQFVQSYKHEGARRDRLRAVDHREAPAFVYGDRAVLSRRISAMVWFTSPGNSFPSRSVLGEEALTGRDARWRVSVARRGA